MKNACAFIVLFFLLVSLFCIDLLFGSVDIPFDDFLRTLTSNENSVYSTILFELRLPKAITAVCVGMALAVSGLLMQTLFRNPLAGPYVLGISSGATLGVAVYVMFFSVMGISFSALSEWSFVVSAMVGASLLFLLVILTSFRVKDSVTLLIVGMMFGSVASAMVSVLQNLSDPDSVKLFVNWTLGSLGTVNWNHLSVMMPLVLLGLGVAFGLQKTLDAFLLGEHYAKGVGVSVFRSRMLIIIATTLLAGATTAFTGPIGFIGIAVPHIARGVLNTSKHSLILPFSILGGAVLLLLCDIISQLPSSGYVLPINAISAIFGAPVILWIILGKNRMTV